MHAHRRADSPLALLDRARGAALRSIAKTPLLPLISRRDTRARTRAIVAVIFAFACTVISPAWMLAISPAIFGVPHIAAATRYLVLRQKLSRAFLAMMIAFAVAMGSMRILEQYGHAPLSFARVEAGVAGAWAIVVVLIAARRHEARTRASLILATVLVATGVAVLHPRAARLLFVHVHNLGAVLLWVVAFRRGKFPSVTIALIFGSLALLVSGVTLPLTTWLHGTNAGGVDLAVVAEWLAPGVALDLAVPLVLAHAFTDSVHYAFWLGVIPDETLTHEGSPTFRMTYIGLVRDFGKVGIAAVALLVAFVLISSLSNASSTRNAYFAIAGFHGYIEGVMLLYILVRGRALSAQASELRATTH